MNTSMNTSMNTMNAIDDLVQKAYDAITVARVSLLLKYPFYGTVAMCLEPVAVVPDQNNQTWLPTAATDGRKLYYNPYFILSLSPQELVYVVAHELLHCVFNHIGRCPDDKNIKLWNIATDYIVNDCLVRNKIGKMVKGGLHDPRYNENEWCAEEVYQDLLERQKKGEKFDIDSWDIHLPAAAGDDDDDGVEDDTTSDNKKPKKIFGNKMPKISKKDMEIIKNELNSMLIQTLENLESSKNAGQIPASIRRLIDKIKHPKLNWRDLLVPYLKSMLKQDYNPKKLHKKAWIRNMYIPALDRDEIPTATIFIDASGSISDNQIAEFLSEIRGCMEQFVDFRLLVGTFDTQVYNVREFTPENLHEIEEYSIQGGGGTDFECFFNYMKEHDIHPERLVVFTDGYPYGSWGDPDYCDTLWIINNKNENIKPPFGQYVYYDR